MKYILIKFMNTFGEIKKVILQTGDLESAYRPTKVFMPQTPQFLISITVNDPLAVLPPVLYLGMLFHTSSHFMTRFLGS
jgi:hypothetical protein